MISNHSHRKDEHVSLAEKFYQPNSFFDAVRFIPNGLPKTSLNQIDISMTAGRERQQN